jgi:O-antigen ligase
VRQRLALAALLTQVWQTWLVALALLLPFELKDAWLNLFGVLQFTNLELAALVALGLWLARQEAVGRRPDRRALGLLGPAIMLLLCTLLLASLFAPSENAHAFKVTARWVAGAATCWMMAEAIQSGLQVRRIAQAITISGAVVALLASVEALEAGGDAFTWFLALFRVEPNFRVGGELRPSATLAYPTITAAYLEFAFCFATGWLALAWTARRRAQTVCVAALLWLIGAALIATLTRSALSAIVLSATVVMGVRWCIGVRDVLSRVFLLALAGLGLMLAVSALVLPTLLLRLSSSSDRDWYVAAYEVAPLDELYAGEHIEIRVGLSNIGQRVWEAGGQNGTFLTYHWLSADGTQIRGGDDVRTPLPHDVAPGASIALQAGLTAPAQAGRYLLAWDMLRNDLFWFSVLGAPMHEMPVQVSASTSRSGSPPAPTMPAVPNVLHSLTADRLTLWSVTLRMLAAHPLSGVGTGNYRLVLGQYLGVPEWDTRLHANNMYLEQFADAGLPGGLAFLLLCALIAWAGLCALRLKLSREKDIIAAVFVTAIAAFLIHGFTDYFLEFTPTYLLFWLTTGLVAGLIHFQE